MRGSLPGMLAALAVLALLIGATGLLRGPWQLIDTPLAPLREALVPGPPEDRERDLVEENLRLRERCAALAERLAAYEEIAAAGASTIDELVFSAATVVNRSDRHGAHVVEIDKGAADGIHRGMAVTVGWSLVGVVRGEQAGRSLVQLVSDPTSRINARLVDQGGVIVALGSLAGTGSWRSLSLDLVEDEPGLTVEPGMLVVSATGPGAVPPGLILGHVTEALRDTQSDHWAIAVRPLRSPALLEHVQVLADLRSHIEP